LNSCQAITCHPLCEVCFGPLETNCIVPIGGKTLDRSNFVISLISACSVGKYWDSLSQGCFDCHISCQRCTGPSRTDCTSCASDLFKWMGVCTSNPNNCLLQNGQTLNPLTEACESCPIDCLYCPDSPTVCVHCKNGKRPMNNLCVACSANSLYCYQLHPYRPIACEIGFKVNTWNDTCTTRCRYGKYPSGANCYDCHPSCGRCHEPGNNRCTECKPKDLYYFDEYNTDNTFCLEALDTTGDYFYSSMPRLRCPSPFKTCSSAVTPLSCHEGFYLSGQLLPPLSPQLPDLLLPEHRLRQLLLRLRLLPLDKDLPSSLPPLRVSALTRWPLSPLQS
jgi:hypothetical protein